MASILQRLGNMFANQRVAAKPYQEQGVAGFGAYGGYIVTPERNPDLLGANRWVTAADLLSNISVIAASVRYSLNLIARPAWRADPPSDKPEAKALAEFVEEVLNGMDTSWSRVVRRSALFRYHGFHLAEWVAKKRDDGRIGIESLEPRPVHTITKWDLDENGGVLGVIQVSPQTGQEIYLPRAKLLYLVDDSLTDRPDGLGWFRHLAEPAERMKRYLKLETMGFERDLAGIPIGRAPIQRINQLVADQKLTRKQADEMIRSLKDFVSLQAKEPTTGLVLDSEPFRGKTENGETISATMQWGLDLLTGQSGSIEQLGNAIKRLQYDMALIIGTESILLGRDPQGSRALSEDKSKNLYLTSNATLGDLGEAMDRDIVTTLWTMNGFPDELRPTLSTEDVSFKDAGVIAKSLADMATAGAILSPNDPAINDLRDLMGIEHAPALSDSEVALMLGGGNQPGGGAAPQSQTGRPSRENPAAANDTGGPEAKPTAKVAPRTMYVERKLLNADELINWAKAQGFDTTTPADQMHVTQAYSRSAVDWMQMGNAAAEVTVPAGGPRVVEPLGDEGAVVLLFRSPELEARHADMLAHGASWDHAGYQPHVTITYQMPDGFDLSKVQPFTGELRFGPEQFSEVQSGWADGLEEE